MSTATWYTGKALTVLATLPDASVDLVLTSPPYLALRSYLDPNDPAKADEMGSESSPGAFIDGLLDVTEELRRVLAPHGSLCVELGDTYAGSGGAGGDYNEAGWREGQEKFKAAKTPRVHPECPPGVDPRTWRPIRTFPVSNQRRGRDGWPLDKSLTGIPELYRLALMYGRNLLTGRETPPWRVRNVVRHFRPNPPVGALGDKVRPATSEWVVACTGRSRFFDLDAVRGPFALNTLLSDGHKKDTAKDEGRRGDRANGNPGFRMNQITHDGAPPLDWWDDDDLEWRDAAGFVAPTFGYPGAHFATFSPAVVARLLKPMCPERVCRTCGLPSVRLVDTQRTLDGVPTDLPAISSSERNGAVADGIGHWRKGTDRTTLGFSDCGHNDWRPGVVLDPFAGSGTTGQVATGHGRDAILIDLDARNAELARERIGWFFDDRTKAVA